MASAVSRHQMIREHLEGHGLEQEQAIALADTFNGLSAELEEAKDEIIRELRDEMRRGNGVTRWMVGITASLAGGALATNVAILIYLVLTHP